jgi:hypothetical protein
MGAPMADVVGHRKGKSVKFIHNDLMQGAHFFRQVCVEKEKAGNRHGIAWDYIACLMFIAFAFEACMNVIGKMKVKDFNERAPFYKFDEVIAAIAVKADWSTRPYSSMKHAKEFRDTIAHGKPEYEEIDEKGDPRELEEKGSLAGEWQKMIEHKRVLECYEDLDVIWKEWLTAGKIDFMDTLSRIDVTVERIEGPV